MPRDHLLRDQSGGQVLLRSRTRYTIHQAQKEGTPMQQRPHLLLEDQQEYPQENRMIIEQIQIKFFEILIHR